MGHEVKGITNGGLYFYLILIIATLISCTPAVKQDKPFDRAYTFSGGPSGGTFKVFAEAIPSLAKEVGVKVKALSSQGSYENVRHINAGKVDFSIAYSYHVYSARNGMLKNDSKKYENVMAVAWLYGAPAQLVVRKGSGIKSAKDLVGKNVSMGNTGSGAFAICKLLFTHMGVWSKIKKKPMGYNDAAAAFGKNKIDALWLITRFPSGAVI